MKRISLFACIILFSGIFSCNFIEENPASGDYPSWIKRKINELSSKTGESCENIWVTVYEVQGKRYFNIDFAYSSCNACNLYDRYGNQVSGGVLANPNETKLIDSAPACVTPR